MYNSKHNSIRIIIFALLSVLLICFIFSNSAESREESAARSEVVAEVIKPVLDPHDQIPQVSFVHYVRKAAHFTEFAALGFSLMGLSDGLPWKRRCLRWSLPLLVGVVIAAADEFSQRFSAGRRPRIVDVLLDFSGAAFGVACMTALLWLIRKAGHKK